METLVTLLAIFICAIPCNSPTNCPLPSTAVVSSVRYGYAGRLLQAGDQVAQCRAASGEEEFALPGETRHRRHGPTCAAAFWKAT